MDCFLKQRCEICMYFTSHRIEPKIGSAACHRIGESIQNCEVNRPIPKKLITYWWTALTISLQLGKNEPVSVGNCQNRNSNTFLVHRTAISLRRCVLVSCHFRGIFREVGMGTNSLIALEAWNWNFEEVDQIHSSMRQFGETVSCSLLVEQLG